jgi:hypothetical protein
MKKRKATDRILDSKNIFTMYNKVWAQMPEEIELMLTLAFNHIAHKKQPPVHPNNPTPMKNRRHESLIPIMTSDKEIEMLSLDPLLCVRANILFPREGAIGLALVLAVDLQSIVHGGSAEHIPLIVGADVFISAGINEQSSATCLQTNAEGIGVVVAATLPPRRPIPNR